MDNTMRRLLLGSAIAVAALPCLASDDDEALDGDFLDYLGTLEGAEEDWTWFADPSQTPARNPKPNASDAQDDPS